MTNEDPVIKIYLVDGSYNNVKYSRLTTIDKIIKVIVKRLSESELDARPYAIRVVPSQNENPRVEDVFWLEKALTLGQVFKKFPSAENLMFQLRIRFLSKNLEEMLLNQTASFFYLYNQIKRQFLSNYWNISLDLMLQLGSLEIRRFLNDMTHSAFEKKSNFEFLVKEIGLEEFFPKKIIAEYKPKTLRKVIHGYFRKYAAFSESDCIFRFFTLLNEVARYDVETFKCFLGSDWAVPVELVVGPEIGMSYVTDSRSKPIKLADFVHVQSIQTCLVSKDALKSVLSIKVATTSEPLIISCSSPFLADSIAELVDGYRLLLTPGNSQSVRTSQDQQNSECSPCIGTSSVKSPKIVAKLLAVTQHESSARLSEDDLDADYSSPVGKNYELDRKNVVLDKLLGEGQFGDVYKGQYELSNGVKVPVAVKSFKIESESVHGSNFLEEAYFMQQFDHPHIVKLIGICSTSPIWIIMELALFGELRTYLIGNGPNLSLLILISFCYQLSSALSYLESRKFVHRDIAARNVLVFGPDEVKLSDFGLSRQVEDQSFYTASKGKLPIKWMAPESINFRRFTQSSDVWMFGVAMWEIMSLGVKPFQGVHNHDVVHKIEEGERLEIPAGCPAEFYSLMLQMWAYEPSERPKMFDVKIILHEILSKEKSLHHSISMGSKESEIHDQSVEWRRCNSVSRPTQRRCFFLPNGGEKNSTKSPKCSKKISNCGITSLDRNGKVCIPRGVHCATSECANERRVSASSVMSETLERMLLTQRIQSEEDSEWLRREETQMSSNLQLANINGDDSSPDLPPRVIEENADEFQSRDKIFPPIKNRKISFAPPPGAEFCRQNDQLYSAVLSVVQSINVMSKNVHHASVDDTVEFVKDVGAALKNLLSLSEGLMQSLPANMHFEISMAEKVLGSCMQKLVGATRFLVRNAQTTLDAEFRRQILTEAHVLAVECKNFLQAADSSRMQAGLAQLVYGSEK